MNLQDLINSIKTVQQRDAVIDALETYSRDMFKDKGRGLMVDLLGQQSDINGELNSVLFELNKADKNRLPKMIEEILKNLRELPEFKIEVFLEPQEDMIAEISKRVRETLGNQALIDIERNSNLIAGVTISYSGHYLDMSLKTELREFFRKHFSDLLPE